MYRYFTREWNADCLIMHDILETIQFYSGSERQKMLYVNGKDGGSMLYGTTWKKYLTPERDREYDEDTGLYKTKIYSESPELKDVFEEFASIYFDDFYFTQVQMNKNFPVPPHLDSSNIGESVLISFGNYKGGLTCIFNAKDNKIIKFDAREKPHKFNGSKCLHWVEPIRGKEPRYSLVFFNNNNKKQLVQT